MRKTLLILALCACDPMVSHRGHVAQEAMIEQIQPGMSQDELLARFGSPSARSAFGAPVWYYIQTRKEAQAFFKPEITDQEVVAISFDAQGNVTEVSDYDESDAQQVVMVEDVTPTEGHSIGFFEQVLGNIGRFNNAPGGPMGTAGSRGPAPGGPVGR